jgi:RND family efflux transporter MFP subunit
MKTRSLVLGFIVAAVVLALGGRAVMSRRASESSAAPKAVAGAAASTPQAALELADGDVIQAAVVELTSTVDVSGGLKAANSAFVKARVAGELKRLSVREGDAVKAGQVIGQIDVIELNLRLKQSEQQAEQSRAQLDIADRALRNNRALVDQGFISPTALDTSVSNQTASQASLQAAQAAVAMARKSLGDATLVAPLSGFVAQRLAQPGERVGVDARIVEVVDLSRVELEAAVPPRDAAELRVGQKATLTVEGLSNVVKATVVRISPTAQAGSRAVPVFLSLDAAPGLRQGLFARGSVSTDQRRVLAIPATMLRNDQPKPSVMSIVNAQVVLKPVVTGTQGSAQGEAMIEIKSGISEGEKLIAAGVGNLRAGTLVRLPTASR